MSRRKIPCETCKTETSYSVWNLRSMQCNKCEGWNITCFHKLIALKMKEYGFDWHRFADEIDELEKVGTAKDLLIKDAEETYKKKYGREIKVDIK